MTPNSKHLVWVGGSSNISLVVLVRYPGGRSSAAAGVAGLNEWLQAEERMKVNSQGTVYIINYPVLWGGIMVPRAGGTVPVAPTAPRGAGHGREAVGGSTAALSCIWRVTFSRWKSFSFGTLIDIDNPTSGPLSIFT